MRAYILDQGGVLTGLPSESYETLEWEEPLYGFAKFTLEINARRLYASELQIGRFLYLPDEDHLLFLIEQMEDHEEPGRDKDLVRVTGRSLEGFAGDERIVVPPVGESHDRQTSVPAETAMKHYVDAHAGPGAVANREVPNLVIAADAAQGTSVTVAARYQDLGAILTEIGLLAAMGWRVKYDPGSGDFVFDVIVGVDHSDDVFLDIAFDTLEEYTELASLLDSKTHAIVGGQGDGVDREIVERFSGLEKTGFNRREAFVDARDVEVGATAVLNARGDAILGAVEPDVRHEATIHAFGSFRYREHWNLGDLILLRDTSRDLEEAVRVVNVKSKIARSLAHPDRTVELGRPMPTLKERVTGSSGASIGGAVDKGSGGGTPTLPLSTRGDLLTRDASTLIRLPVGAAGRRLISDGTDPLWTPDYADSIFDLGYIGGPVLGVGVQGLIGPFDFACAIEMWRLFLEQNGAIVLGLWKGTLAEWEAGTIVSGDDITGSAPPTITASHKANSSSTLTGWSPNLAVGDVLAVNIVSISAAAYCHGVLKLRKTT